MEIISKTKQKTPRARKGPPTDDWTPVLWEYGSGFHKPTALFLSTKGPDIPENSMQIIGFPSDTDFEADNYLKTPKIGLNFKL